MAPASRRSRKQPPAELKDEAAVRDDPAPATSSAITVAADALSESTLAAASDDSKATATTAASTTTSPVAAPAKKQAPMSAVLLAPAVQFALLALSSLCLASLGHSLAGEWLSATAAGAGMAAVARGGAEYSAWEVALLVGWKLVELSVAWFANLDAYELLSLAVLLHGPSFYLLAAFYKIAVPETLAYLAVDLLSLCIPFQIVRQLSVLSARTQDGPTTTKTLFSTSGLAYSDGSLALPVQAYTAVLAGTIYSTVLFAAYQSFLSTTLVVSFPGIRSVEPAHSASYANLLPVTLFFGLALSVLVYPPAAGAQGGAETGPADANTTTSLPTETAADAVADRAETAMASQSLWAAMQHRVRVAASTQWASRTTTSRALQRTLAASALSGVSTYLACAHTLADVEPRGAAAFAAVWSAAALAAGLGLTFVAGGA